MSKYDLVIWDVDGTLLNTAEGILSSAVYTIECENMILPSHEIMKTYIGPPIQKSFANTLNVSSQKASSMAEVFRQHYKKFDLFKAYPYKGILELLCLIKQLKIKQAVATYKREDYAYKILQKFAMAEHMDSICGSDFAGLLNKADIIKNAINNMHFVPSKRIVMIGDTENDLLGAESAGIDFIGVAYGFGFKNKIDGVKIALDVNDLKRLLFEEADV